LFFSFHVYAQEVFEKFQTADQFTLYSLKPERTKEGETFYNWKILKKVEISDIKTREDLKDALKKGIAQSDPKIAARCFNPRHGIKILQGKETFELVICFECLRMDSYKNGHQVEGFSTTASPESFLNKILKKSKLSRK
jgi:hypothetical protein